MRTKMRTIRKTTRNYQANRKLLPTYDVESFESDTEIWNKLDKRFRVLDTLTDHVIRGSARSLIVYGPAGLGKSYTVEAALERRGGNYEIIKGGATKIGLLRTLYKYRSRDCVVVFDDCDSILLDLDCISLLKAACDTTERRRISYMTNDKIAADDEIGTIPGTWDFEGRIIFITNTDFTAAPSKLAPHCEAMVSRSHYIALQMKSSRDYIIRIKQVVSQGLFEPLGLRENMIVDVMRYIDDNEKSLRELSLRMAIKLGALRKDSGDDWKEIADVTCRKGS